MSASVQFKLRFPTQDIAHWAARYSYPGEDRIVRRVAPAARARGYLRQSEFLEVCKWKTPRSQSRCATNPADTIREATRLALHTADERLKIGILRVLTGVEWPTASVILHFCDHRPYPILDYRALWSLGHPNPPTTYTFDFWWEYTQFTRHLADNSGHSMRDLDRALWQYSKERQRQKSSR
jgi:hypothetical protein